MDLIIDFPAKSMYGKVIRQMAREEYIWRCDHDSRSQVSKKGNQEYLPSPSVAIFFGGKTNEETNDIHHQEFLICEHQF